MFPHTSIVKNCMDNDGAVQNVQHATPRCRVFLWVSGKAHSEEEIVAGHLSPVLVSVSQLAFREKKKKTQKTNPALVCSLYSFPWCKHLGHGPGQASNVTLLNVEMGGDGQ